MTDAAISVRNLHKSFSLDSGWRGLIRGAGTRAILRGVDIEVRVGEIVGLLGPNGAGKTTLIKILSGLIWPDSGDVRVAGYDLSKESTAAQRVIGVVYGDERSFYWRLSLIENLRFYASLYGLDRTSAAKRIHELLVHLDLTASQNMRMYTFSAGMKQRAAIARGLLNDPEILFMDEPTRGLDPLGVEDLHSLIRDRVVAGGRTVLLATNLMSEAEALCDRVILIGRGLIQAEGTIQQLRDWSHQEVTYKLVVNSASNNFQKRLGAIPGITSVQVHPVSGTVHGVELAMQKNGDALPSAIRALVEESVEIRACTKAEPSLEEVFLQIMRPARMEAAEVAQ